jgi:hypothetical protein
VLTSVAVRAGELLAVVLAAGTITLAAGLWWLRRRMRRLRRAGRVMAGRAAVVAAGAAARRGAWSVPLPDRRWLAAARERRRLWRAVGAAEHAVAGARQAGAPAGELGDMCRRLREAAGYADRCLSVSGRPAASRAVHGAGALAEVSGVVTAAGLIQDAAASALAAMARPAAASLADDARREAAALAAGIAAAGLHGDGG